MNGIRFLLLLALAAILAVAQPSLQVLTAKPNSVASYKTRGPFASALIPRGYGLDIDSENDWKAGDQVWVRYELNNGNYNARFDGPNVNAWIPLECRYGTEANKQPPWFLGCFDGTSNLETRLDSPVVGQALNRTEGATVLFVTKIEVVVKRSANANQNKPEVEVTIPVREYTTEEQQVWLNQMRDRNDDNPGADCPWPVAVAHKFVHYFTNHDGQDKIPLLRFYYSKTARYGLEGVTNFTNDGTSTDNIQSYFATGSTSSADPNFANKQVNYEHIELAGSVAIVKAEYVIQNPHLPTTSNTIVSPQAQLIGFNRYGLVQGQDQLVNLLPFYFQGLQSQALFNTTDMCIKIMTKVCRNNLEQSHYPASQTCPYPMQSDPSKCSTQQYDSVQDCINYVSSLPVGPPLTASGLHQACIHYHFDIALAGDYSASIHCLHVGREVFPAGLPFGVHTACHNPL